jgi:hypothetical protein
VAIRKEVDSLIARAQKEMEEADERARQVVPKE